MKKIFTIMMIMVITLCCLSSCGGNSASEKNKDSNEKGQEEQVANKEEQAEPIKVDFRDIKLSLPAEYQYDSKTFDKYSKNYIVLDEEGNVLKQITVSYSDDEVGNVLKPDVAEKFCTTAVNTNLGTNYDGYETTSIDSSLSAIKYLYQYALDELTYNTESISFNDGDGHVYSITSSAMGDPEEDLKPILESLEYKFDIYKDKYDLKLLVEFESNWFLDIYDVDVYVDRKKVGSISQGNTLDMIISVDEGDHNIRFEKYDDDKVVGETGISISEAMVLACSIKSHSENIDVNNKKVETLESYTARKEKEEQERIKREAEKAKEEEERKAKEEAAKKEREKKAAAEKKKAAAKAKKAARRERAYKKLGAEGRNAYQDAVKYLEYMPFSKKGLINQLSSKWADKYPKKTAKKAVRFMEKWDKVNWTKQAKRAAKLYLKSDNFSKAGLISQLESPYADDFTHKQAVAAVKAVYK